MKGLISFISACAIYLLGGLIVWNIVCSIIDVPSQTIIGLSNYRIFTYSGLTAAIMLITFLIHGGEDGALHFILFIIAVNAGIAVATNYWENIWTSVSTILTIVYNIVNILFITLSIRLCFKD